MKRILLLFVISPFLLFPNNRAYASGEMCKMLRDGKTLLTREVETLRVLDQGCVHNCWLHTYVALAEQMHLKYTGNRTPISVGYLIYSDLRVRLFAYVREAEDQVDLGDPIATGDMLMRTYGFIPDEVWKPNIPSKDLPLETEWIPELMDLVDDMKADFYTDSQIWAKVDRRISELFGYPPHEFTWNEKTYTPTQFAHKYLNLDDNKTFFEYITRSSQKRSYYCKNFTHCSHLKAEQAAMEWLDAGYSVTLSYFYNEHLHTNEPGLLIDENPYMLATNGSHAILVTGYLKGEDGRVLAWKVQNSWGTKAGLNGNYYMSQQFFERYVVKVSLYSILN